jgi:cysteine desulfurase family protein
MTVRSQSPGDGRAAMIYLDNGSTSSPKPDCVWESARDFLSGVGASPGRSGHRLARMADEMVEQTRESLAGLFGTRQPKHIAFTSNATAGLNACLKGFLQHGDRVVTTAVEHNSVLRPLESLKRRGIIEYVTAVPDAEGRFDLDWFQDAIAAGTRLVVLNHASNVTGAVTPVAEITKITHEHGAAVLLDVSQTAGCVDIDLDGWGIDMMAFTGHKGLLGPSGIGGMYIRDPSAVDTTTEGGTGISSQSLRQSAVMPAKFESGTLNYMGIAGLNAALKFAAVAPDKSGHLSALIDQSVCGLGAVRGVTVYRPAVGLHLVPVVSFNLAGLYAAELAAILDDRFGIMTRAGLHCAPLCHATLGTAPHGTVRASFGVFTTAEDVAALVSAVTVIGSDISRYMQ